MLVGPAQFAPFEGMDVFDQANGGDGCGDHDDGKGGEAFHGGDGVDVHGVLSWVGVGNRECVR
jgi:hypothetical protein